MQASCSMSVLCFSYPNTPEEVYSNSLTLDLILQSICGLTAGIGPKGQEFQNETFFAYMAFMLLLCWAGYLFKKAPNDQNKLTEGLRTSARYFGWIKVVWGWISLTGSSVLIVVLIVVVIQTNNNQNASPGLNHAGADRKSV